MCNLSAIKLTTQSALMITMSILGGLEITPATAATKKTSFLDFCQQQASLSADTRITVEVLLQKAGTNDCEIADKKLSNLTRLHLNGKGISDLTPLSSFTNLEYLNY